MQSLKVLAQKRRNSSVDVFRAIAILSVVLFHFNHFLPYGELGVDLFFVISGLLVGGLLTKGYVKGEKISFWKFVLQRGFKIWPSYYAFLIIGNILAYLLFKTRDPGQIIPFWDLKRYIFFYQNYTGLPFHISFDHVWSLCVEEHFYIGLPILMILLQYFRAKKQVLFIGVGMVIIAGVLFKIASLYLTHSKDTYSGTHNRIDALAWGVLLNLLITYYTDKIKNARWFFLLGILIFATTVTYSFYTTSIFYQKVVLHSLIPIGFFAMLLGLYFVNFYKWKILRFLAYYSYNWYLWHPIIATIVLIYIGNTLIGLTVYLISSFSVAVLFTTLVEEPVLNQRSRIINSIFKNNTRVKKTEKIAT